MPGTASERGSVVAGPAVVDGTVYWGSGYARTGGVANNKFYAFSIEKGGFPCRSNIASIQPSGSHAWATARMTSSSARKRPGFRRR